MDRKQKIETLEALMKGRKAISELKQPKQLPNYDFDKLLYNEFNLISSIMDRAVLAMRPLTEAERKCTDYYLDQALTRQSQDEGQQSDVDAWVEALGFTYVKYTDMIDLFPKPTREQTKQWEKIFDL